MSISCQYHIFQLRLTTDRLGRGDPMRSPSLRGSSSDHFGMRLPFQFSGHRWHPWDRGDHPWRHVGCWMMLDDVGCIFSSTDLGFLVRYTVLVSFIFLNLFIAVIFEGFEESRLPSIHSCPTFSAVDIRYISMSCIQYDHHMIIILDHHI